MILILFLREDMRRLQETMVSADNFKGVDVEFSFFQLCKSP